MKSELDADELNLVKLAREYSDNDKARLLLEQLRWPDGAICPHCQAGEPYTLTPGKGSTTRKGLYKCHECRKQFSVSVGTIFESSHISLGTWLMAIFILCSAKKGVSAHQLHRMLDITYKSAWFMAHRIRYAMSPDLPLGKMLSGVVEIDETYVGGKPRHGTGPRKRGRGTRKIPVVALVERGGDVRPKVVADITGKTLLSHVVQNTAAGTIVNTDELSSYGGLTKLGFEHKTVNHSAKEYAKGDSFTNTAESFFSLLKRGVIGSWHHVSKEHLHRYCDEVGFRWNQRRVTDGEHMAQAVKATAGKRLFYRKPTA